MRASLNSGHFSLMPRLVVDPQWLQQLPAYFSEDGRVVRAVLRLLDHAWRGTPAGTVHVPNLQSLAELCGLPLEVLNRELKELQAGWRIGKAGTWVFEPMQQLAQSLLQSHKESLEYLANELLIQAQSPDLFGPTSGDTQQAVTALQNKATPVTARSTKAVRRLLPDLFELTASMRAEIEQHGLAPTRYAEIKQRFVDFARSRAERSADWDATFRNWLRNAIQWRTIDVHNAEPGGGTRYQFATAGAARSARARDDSYYALQRAKEVVQAHAAG